MDCLPCVRIPRGWPSRLRLTHLTMLAPDAWRSVYWSEQVSIRTRVLLMIDWVKRGIFGRDLSRVGRILASFAQAIKLTRPIALCLEQF